MATRKSGAKRPVRTPSSGKAKSDRQSEAASGTTGPSSSGPPATGLAEHAAEQAALAEAMPFNAAKSGEYACEPACNSDQVRGEIGVQN